MNAKQRRQAKRSAKTQATLEPSQIRTAQGINNSEQTIHPPSPAQATTRSLVFFSLITFSILFWIFIAYYFI